MILLVSRPALTVLLLVAILVKLVVASTTSTSTTASSLVEQIHKLRDRTLPLAIGLHMDLTSLSSQTLLCTMRLLVQKKDTARMLELLPLYLQKNVDNDVDLYICGLMLDAIKTSSNDKDVLALIANIQKQQEQMPRKTLDVLVDEMQFARCLKHDEQQKGKAVETRGLTLKQCEFVLKFAQSWPSVARLRTALMQREREREEDDALYVSAVTGLALLEAVCNDRSNELACLHAKKEQKTSQTKVLHAYSHAIAFLDNLVESSEPFEFEEHNKDNNSCSDDLVVVDWNYVQQLVFECCKKPSQLKHASWKQLRSSQVLDSYCHYLYDEQQDTSPPLLLRVANQCKQIVLLGEGDFSFATSFCSLLSAQQQPSHAIVHATSLEEQVQVEKKYVKASSSIERLSAMKNTFVHFNVDATSIPTSFASLDVDLFLFMFPFADAAIPSSYLYSSSSSSFSSSSSSSSAAFDTHFFAKRRHMQLLDGFFASCNTASASRIGVHVGVALLLSQAVAWNIEKIAFSRGFVLSSMSPFSDDAEHNQFSLYQRRRSYNDDSFPQGHNDRKSSSVLFFFTKTT